MRSPRSLGRTARAAVLALLGACGSATAPADPSAPLVAEAGADALRLTNRGDRTVFIFAADQEALPLMFWAPCVDPARCRPIAPGASRDVAYGTAGLGRGRVAVVTWWYARRTAAGDEPDALHTFVVHL